jgi:predicted ArsR family transcriptional regulator
VNEQTPSAPPTAHDALAVSSRRELLAVLRESGTALDARVLAQRSGLHVNTVRFHLNVLIEAGFVQQSSGTRSGPGRPQALYASLTPEVQAGGYQLLAEILAGRLEQEGGHDTLPEQAGRAWATTVAAPAAAEVSDPPAPAAMSPAVSSSALSVATDRAVALFTELGFEPVAVPATTGSRIELHACPFLDVARRHPGVVCGVHRGLLDATVDGATADADGGADGGAAGGGLTTTLTPFARPGICIAELIPRN